MKRLAPAAVSSFGPLWFVFGVWGFGGFWTFFPGWVLGCFSRALGVLLLAWGMNKKNVYLVSWCFVRDICIQMIDDDWWKAKEVTIECEDVSCLCL